MPEICNPSDCPLSPRVEALERANEQHSETHREIFERVRALETSDAVQNAHYEAIDTKLDEIKVTVQTLVNKPVKRFDGLVDKVLWFILEAALIVVAVKIGLK